MRVCAICLTLIFAYSVKGLSQEGGFLDMGNISAYVHSSGMLFNNPQFSVRSQFPKGSGKSTIYLSNLIVGAKDNQGRTYVAAQTYHQGGRDFSTGPISNLYDEAYRQKYERVWRVSAEQIAYHLASFNDSSYQIPEEIENWPAHGDTSLGEQFYLAPFIDTNQNGIYEPHFGDVPAIRGEQAILFILNDLANYHAITGGNAMGIEIIGMAYTLKGQTPESVLSNTVFVNYKVRNTGLNDFPHFRFANYSDFDLGYHLDDQLGFSGSNEMFFVYNGDEYDEGSLGYGESPPAQGVVFLGELLMNCVFPGPILPGSDGFFQTHLSKEGVYLPSTVNPSDVSGLVSSDPHPLPKNGFMCFDIAFVFSRGSGSALSSVQKLQSDASTVRTVFNNFNTPCNDNRLGIPYVQEEFIHFEVFPNPSSGLVYYSVRDDLLANNMITIYDIQGHTVGSVHLSETGYCMGSFFLPPGFYLVEWQSEHYRKVQKLIVR